MPKTFLINLTKWIIIPLAFLFAGVVLSFVYLFNSDINSNVIHVNHSASNVENTRGVVSGKFTAQGNYLGIVTIRFAKKKLLNGNSIFRIKNVQDNDWYQTSIIPSTQYYYLPFYSFGFPVIEKSKNQMYQFEIRLLSKNEELVLSQQEPVLVSNYAYPKEVLLKNLSLLINFLKNKISYYFFTQNFFKVFFIFNIPLFLYLLYILIFYRFIPKKIKLYTEKLLKVFTKPTMFIPIVAMAIDIFFTRKNNIIIILLLTLLWIIAVITYRLKTKITFFLALLFLSLCPFLIIGSMEIIAEKSAIWLFFMFVIGIFQLLIENSPLFQEIIKNKFFQFIISQLRFIFLRFDRLIISFITKFHA